MNLPKRGLWNMRTLFVPDPGKVFIIADAAQAELRVIAIEANDVPMLKAFTGGEDVHMQNAIDLFGEGANKEQRNFGKRFVFGCVSLDTQALTRDGWKDYFDLRVGEDILTYNQETHCKEWAPVLQKTYHRRAPVFDVAVTTRSFHMLTTEDHRWFVRQRTQSKLVRDHIHQVRTTGTLNSESNIIVNAPMTPDVFGLDSVLCAEKYGVDWTQRVCRMSSDQRRAFLQGFLLADGYLQKGRKTPHWVWGQNDNEIAEAVLTASYLEHDGVIWCSPEFNHHSQMKQARLSSKPYITGQKLRREPAGEIPVWCPTTSNGSWVARRGDCITITGNSNYGGSDETLWQQLVVQYPHLKLRAVTLLKRRWFRRHPAIKALLARNLEVAQRTGKLPAPVGPRVWEFFEGRVEPNEVYNRPIQATVAWFMNRALCRLHAEGFEIVAFCHDEIIVQVPVYRKWAAAEAVAAAMEEPVVLRGKPWVFPAEPEQGDSWGNPQPLEDPCPSYLPSSPLLRSCSHPLGPRPQSPKNQSA